MQRGPLGETLAEAGQHRDAVSAHGRAIDLGAGYPWSSPFAIARIHARQRHADSTLFWLDEALRKRYRDLDRIRADTTFAWLHSNPRFRSLAALS